MIEKKNYSGQVAPDVGGETEFERCNFAQPEPVLDGALYIGTRLWPGDDTPRTFTKCNLVNCHTPPGSVMIDCNQAVRRSMVVTSTDEIVIDGHQIEANNYVDITYGYRKSGGSYEYYDPIDVMPNKTVVE